jgi:DNA-binding beta-propeller fold protein YncE
LPDASGFIGLAPPDLVLIRTTFNGLPLPVGASGCPVPFPSGQISVSNGVTTVPLAAGSFTPLALFVSSDGQNAYMVARNSSTIIRYGIISGLTSSFSLVGNPNPLSAALSPDGQTLYVGASDGKVHFVNTVSGGDAAQVDVPSSSLCTVITGGTQPNCLPDLIAVKP